jgi:hypothetical protein
MMPTGTSTCVTAGIHRFSDDTCRSIVWFLRAGETGVQLLTVLARKGGVKKSKRGSVLMIELQTR